jgi:signal peptidase I
MANLTTAALLLNAGIEQVTVRPRGTSMEPLIRSGQLVILKPVDHDLKPGEIVLATVGRSIFLHKVLAVDGDRVQIGNNKGGVNGWAHRSNVHGYLAKASRKRPSDTRIRNDRPDRLLKRP